VKINSIVTLVNYKIDNFKINVLAGTREIVLIPDIGKSAKPVQRATASALPKAMQTGGNPNSYCVSHNGHLHKYGK
jgi:hypothetical protein